MPLRHFQRQYEQLSQFEKGRTIGMMEAGWSARRVARHLGRSDCVVRRRLAEGHLGSQHPLRVLPLTPPINASVWSGAMHEETRLQRNETRSSLARIQIQSQQ
ncbi:UNVERIFIED_CONTAM: hypothetical protein NCL1_22757 [Trichonephila clavipes]